MFKVGDRVRHDIGTVGTVITVESDSIGVQFDEDFLGSHTLDGLCDSRGYYVAECELTIIPPLLTVGDRVNYKGYHGIILTEDQYIFGIKFDHKIPGGDTLDQVTELGYGFWVKKGNLALRRSNKPMIKGSWKPITIELTLEKRTQAESLKTFLDDKCFGATAYLAINTALDNTE